MNEQTPEKELKKIEIINLSDAEFKTLIIRMLNEHRGRVDELRVNLNNIKNDTETIKKIQSEMKNILTEIKNNLQGISSRVDKAEKLIRDLQ